MNFLKKLCVIIASVFVLVSSIVVPVSAVDNSGSLRPVPDLPSVVDDFSHRVIVYFEDIDTFYLLACNASRVLGYSGNGGAVDPSSESTSVNKIAQLYFYFSASSNAVLYALTPLTSDDWQLQDIQGFSFINYTANSTNPLIFNFNSGQGSLQYHSLVYSNVDVKSGANYTFFQNPSPIANTAPYLQLHTGLFQTVRGAIQVAMIAGITVMAVLIAVLLVRKLRKMI